MAQKRVFYKGWSRREAKQVFHFLFEQQMPRNWSRSPLGGRWNGSAHLQPPRIEWDERFNTVVAKVYGRGKWRHDTLLKVWPNGSWHFDPQGVLTRSCFNTHPWSHYRWMVSTLSPCYVWRLHRNQPFDALYLDGQLFPVKDVVWADGLYWNNRTKLFNVVPVVTPSSLGRYSQENPIKDRRLVKAIEDPLVKVSEVNQRLWTAILLNPNVSVQEKLPILEGQNRYFWEVALRNVPYAQQSELGELALKRWPRSWAVAEFIIKGPNIPLQLKMKAARQMRKHNELRSYFRWASKTNPSVDLNRLAASAGMLDEVQRG